MGNEYWNIEECLSGASRPRCAAGCLRREGMSAGCARCFGDKVDCTLEARFAMVFGLEKLRKGDDLAARSLADVVFKPFCAAEMPRQLHGGLERGLVRLSSTILQEKSS